MPSSMPAVGCPLNVARLPRRCTPAAWQDFAREADPGARLASLSLKRFATLIFNACPGLQPYSGALDAIYKQFSDYKQARSCNRPTWLALAPRPTGSSCAACSEQFQNTEALTPHAFSPCCALTTAPSVAPPHSWRCVRPAVQQLPCRQPLHAELAWLHARRSHWRHCRSGN